MRKFDIPKRKSKRAFPRAIYLGEVVSVRGVARLDEAQRVYYRVRPAGSRQKTVAVRCDKLIAID
jgi:hypothetical protein